MITNQLLRECLFSIFFNNKPEYEKFIAPINYSWYIPKESINNLQDTWIGYSVLSHYSLQQTATQYGSTLIKSLKTRFRITFTGQQAEEIANSLFLWENKEDVNRIFLEKMYAKINFDESSCYSKTIDIDNQESLVIWASDMSANSYYVVDTQQTPWVPINGEVKLKDNQQSVVIFPFDDKTKNYKEMTLEETINCKDRVPGKGLNDYYCRNNNCECLYKGYDEVYLYIDSQELSQGRKAKYTGATR